MSHFDCGGHKHRSRMRRGPRRERTALDLDRIVDAAIDLADTRGPEAVTMRGVASHLGVGVMSLYWYVSTKRDLEGEMCLRLMQDATAQIHPSGNWREDLASLARGTRNTILQHGWLVDLVGRIDFKDQPALVEGKLRHIDQTMRIVESLPVDTSAQLRIVSMLDNFTRGFALWEIIMKREIDAIDDLGAEPPVPSTTSEPGDGSMPEPSRQMLRELESFDLERQFEFALQTLLDGIETQLARGTIDNAPPTQ